MLAWKGEGEMVGHFFIYHFSHISPLSPNWNDEPLRSGNILSSFTIDVSFSRCLVRTLRLIVVEVFSTELFPLKNLTSSAGRVPSSSTFPYFPCFSIWERGLQVVGFLLAWRSAGRNSIATSYSCLILLVGLLVEMVSLCTPVEAFFFIRSNPRFPFLGRFLPFIDSQIFIQRLTLGFCFTQ